MADYSALDVFSVLVKEATRRDRCGSKLFGLLAAILKSHVTAADHS
jgi:hypothetical protein